MERLFKQNRTNPGMMEELYCMSAGVANTDPSKFHPGISLEKSKSIKISRSRGCQGVERLPQRYRVRLFQLPLVINFGMLACLRLGLPGIDESGEGQLSKISYAIQTP